MQLRSRFKSIIFLCIISLPLNLLFTNCADDTKPADNASAAAAPAGPPELSSGQFSGTVSGSLSYVTTSGIAWGYALDPKNKDSSIRVYFYADGPVGKGTLVGDSLANVESLGANSGHFFSFQIPPAFADAKAHTLYVYGYSAVADFLIKASPQTFTAFTPKAEATYNLALNSFVQSTCNKCHGWNYRELYFSPLMNPSPLAGGSATNNVLIKKMTGATGHGGGTFCSSLTAFPCSDIQAWWNAEFK
jgi:hypothetical protein